MRKARFDGRPRPRSEILTASLQNHCDGAARNFSSLAKAADASEWSHEEQEANPLGKNNDEDADSKDRKDAKRIVGEAERGAKRRADNAIASGENCTRSHFRTRCALS